MAEHLLLRQELLVHLESDPQPDLVVVDGSIHCWFLPFSVDRDWPNLSVIRSLVRIGGDLTLIYVYFLLQST